MPVYFKTYKLRNTIKRIFVSIKMILKEMFYTINLRKQRMHTTGLKMVDNQTNKSRHHLPSVLNNWPDTDYTFCIQNIYLLFCKFYIFLMILIDNVLSNKEINWLHDNVCICLLSIIYNLDVYIKLKSRLRTFNIKT